MVVSLLASGSNAHGQLAHETIDDSHIFSPCIFKQETEYASTFTPQKILQIASGGNHTLVLVEMTDSGNGTKSQLWGCGDASLGQLGPLLDGDVLVFTPIDLQESELQDYCPRLICASWQTTYIVLSCPGKSDCLISMGSDDFGDLGIGKPKRKGRVKPCRVKFDHLFVGDASLDGLHLTINSISAGQHHVILQLAVRLKDGSYQQLVVGWGTARHGELGILNNPGKTSFVSLPQIIENVDAKEISSFSLGNQHSAFLKSKKVFNIGSNKRGQANGLEELEEVAYVGCTWNGTYIVNSDDSPRIYATGSYSKGQLGRTLPPDLSSDTVHSLAPVEFPFSPSSRRLLKLACGSEHVLALYSVQLSYHPDCTTETEIWGWGWNEHGNLGTNSTDDVHLPVRIWPPSPERQTDTQIRKKAIGIWAGCGTSWITVES